MRSICTSLPSPFRSTLIAGLLVVALPLTGCSSSENRADTESAATTEAFGHIHSLDVNPVDDQLYVATHNGLFAQTATGFERVGNGQQDMMSFTIAGPDRFLISGHPKPATGEPAHLGLTESTDGGKSWKSLSLEGEADFHALEAAEDRVYGVDSQTGRLMVTTDGSRWRNLGELPAVDVAADPANPGRLLLTGGDGALIELDGREAPRRVESVPSLVLLDWVSEDLLVGAGPDGSIHRSDDGGKSWQKTGSLPGAPHALTATGSRWYAATEDGIVASENSGKTWSAVRSQ